MQRIWLAVAEGHVVGGALDDTVFGVDSGATGEVADDSSVDLATAFAPGADRVATFHYSHGANRTAIFGIQLMELIGVAVVQAPVEFSDQSQDFIPDIGGQF